MLLEVLLIVAAAEFAVMLILPELELGLGSLGEGLLDMAMLLLLAGPATYWRLVVGLQKNRRSDPALAPVQGRTHRAVGLTALTQILGLLLTAGGVWWLKGARGAMAANSTFTRQSFRAYVASRDLPSEFPGIRGFGLIQQVPRTELARFVARERADGAPDFAVHSQGAAPNLYVVKYVEPLADNREALGFDMGQDMHRRQAA